MEICLNYSNRNPSP